MDARIKNNRTLLLVRLCQKPCDFGLALSKNFISFHTRVLLLVATTTSTIALV
jgi:hypothetical protein